ncbi:basic salivary proline-rich protein 1-like [Moschus berezovskii]|uniref:basic salivary proline-rich protein 1-like n=1 Tax=Moschus berezovskii TaxID=68408 RepID=UPI0024450B9B|nr:basic salivary proline-rich protein 1-like [Moschus berezovskii]
MPRSSLSARLRVPLSTPARRPRSASRPQLPPASPRAQCGRRADRPLSIHARVTSRATPPVSPKGPGRRPAGAGRLSAPSGLAGAPRSSQGSSQKASLQLCAGKEPMWGLHRTVSSRRTACSASQSLRSPGHRSPPPPQAPLSVHLSAASLAVSSPPSPSPVHQRHSARPAGPPSLSAEPLTSRPRPPRNPPSDWLLCRLVWTWVVDWGGQSEAGPAGESGRPEGARGAGSGERGGRPTAGGRAGGSARRGSKPCKPSPAPPRPVSRRRPVPAPRVPPLRVAAGGLQPAEPPSPLRRTASARRKADCEPPPKGRARQRLQQLGGFQEWPAVPSLKTRSSLRAGAVAGPSDPSPSLPQMLPTPSFSQKPPEAALETLGLQKPRPTLCAVHPALAPSAHQLPAPSQAGTPRPR